MVVRCNLSTLMGGRRYTIADVHQKTGLARKTISNLYNDKATRIDFDTLAKLCDALNCTVGELLIISHEEAAMKNISEKVGKENER